MSKKIIFILIAIFVLSIIGAGITLATLDDVSFINKIEIDQEETLSITDVNAINIDSGAGDVRFILVDSNEITVKYYGSVHCFICNVEDLSANKENDTINIKSNQKLFAITFHNTLKMDIYLPTSYARNLNVDAISGDINLNNMNLEKLDVYSTSGDIILENLNISSGYFKTISGDIELSNIEVGNDDIDMSIISTSGSITVDSLTSNLYFKTISGDVDIINHEGDVKGSTTSGEIEVQVISNVFKIDVFSTSGDIDLDLNSNAEFIFTCDSVSGKINVRRPYTVDNSIEGSHDVEGRVGDSTNFIDVDTTSGDITIN